MAGFFYFIPGDPRELVKVTDSFIGEDLLAKADLLDALGDWRVNGNQTVVHRTNHVRLDGNPVVNNPGVILFPRPHDGGDLPLTIYDPERMQFLKYSNKHYIGWLRDDPPNPDDLRRAALYHSYFLTDEVGDRWLVPIINSPQEDRGSLPVDITVDMESGHAKIQQKACYEKVWNLTGEFRDKTTNRDESLNLNWMLDAAIQILNINYRIPKSAVGALSKLGRSLFDSERLQLIMMMACDWSLVKEFEELSEDVAEKKTDEVLPVDSPRPLYGPKDAIVSETQLAGSLR